MSLSPPTYIHLNNRCKPTSSDMGALGMAVPNLQVRSTQQRALADSGHRLADPGDTSPRPVVSEACCFPGPRHVSTNFTENIKTQLQIKPDLSRVHNNIVNCSSSQNILKLDSEMELKRLHFEL